MYVMSSANSTGGEAAIIHILKFYNLLMWVNSFDINEEYAEYFRNNTFRFK
jgi:hypothetical protein